MLDINLTFILALISFLVFLAIIKAVLFEPITKVIEEREGFFAKNLKMETESKEKTKALLKEKEELLAKTRSEASDIIKEASDSAKKQGEEIVKKAKAQVLEKTEENKKLLEQESINAKFEAKDEIRNIVKTIASKVLDEEVEITLQDERINQYLKI